MPGREGGEPDAGERGPGWGAGPGPLVMLSTDAMPRGGGAGGAGGAAAAFVGVACSGAMAVLSASLPRSVCAIARVLPAPRHTHCPSTALLPPVWCGRCLLVAVRRSATSLAPAPAPGRVCVFVRGDFVQRGSRRGGIARRNGGRSAGCRIGPWCAGRAREALLRFLL